MKMHVSSVLPFMLAAAPVAVSARGTLGFSLGNKNPDGSCKGVSDYEADFDALRPLTNVVRTYSASNCDTAKNIVPAAKSKGFKVVLGVWYAAYCLLSLLSAFFFFFFFLRTNVQLPFQA